ncbi:acetylornithine deacetylase [Plastorhodobacter daqingensis]|uniref:Acetylornithine deacetylase n=1 Tax=Plastorhodobacter daqingensis TaxID=1387281 RepID=A0ABW2ULB5_9RHOB
MPDALSARDILARLVSFPTVSRDSNLELVDWVERYLADLGVSAHRVPSPCGNKASLFAHIGPEEEGGVILSGHSDVVPVDGQAWSSDPWCLMEREGRLYGRGTCDMKGFVALALAAVPLALQANLRRPLQIALSYDEELGCLGAPPMIAHMASLLPRAAAVVVGEPSMMKAVNGHKGGIAFDIHMRGYEVHSSILHRGVSAIMEGARLIDWANQQNAANRARTPAAMAALFDPPFTTIHVGTISGGTAANITARECRFGIDFRCVPGETVEHWSAALHERAAALEAEMKEIRPEAGIEITRRFLLPPLVPEPEGAAERLVRKLTGDNATHVVSYGTEAGQFQAEGYSAIVCGPGDIAQAHQPDEYITVAQFEAGWAFMERLVQELSQ